MQDTFLRTNQRQHLTLRVEIHVVPTLVEVGHRLAQLWRTLCGLVAVGIRLTGHLTQLFDGLL